MAPCYDLAVSSLLCSEDNSCILGFDDGDEAAAAAAAPGVVERWRLGEMLDAGFPVLSEEGVRALVQREAAHLPCDDYAGRLLSGGGPRLDASVRHDAVSWIWMAHECYSFGPLTACLAVNYLDRFLSLYELPEGKIWMTQLLSVACLSLAAKMEERSAPLLGDLQLAPVERRGGPVFVFEAKTIQRMELLVLSTLNWRMQAVTPFSFIEYFFHRLNGGNAPPGFTVIRSTELLLSICRDAGFLAFRPSEIAAAVAVTVLGGDEVSDIVKAVSPCIHVKKERVMKCCEAIRSMKLENAMLLKFADSPRTVSVPPSPNGVLDAGCFSYKSNETSTLISTDTCQGQPANKRRKIGR